MTEETEAPKEKKLTQKERLFVQEYMVDFNGAAAARRAGYSEKSAREIACQNLTKLHIAKALDEEMQKNAGVTRARIAQELATIAFANTGDYFKWGQDGVVITSSDDLTDEQKAVVSEIQETKTKDGNITIKIKLSDKQAALEKLGRALQMFTDKQVQVHDVTDNFKDFLKEINDIGETESIIPGGEDEQ